MKIVNSLISFSTRPHFHGGLVLIMQNGWSDSMQADFKYYDYKLKTKHLEHIYAAP